MAFDLSGFKTALEFGGARPSLFEFSVTSAPTGVSPSLSDVKLYCNVSALPGLTLTPIERQYFGRTVKIPGDMVFGDLSTTIMNTERYTIRNTIDNFIIEDWLEDPDGRYKNIEFYDIPQYIFAKMTFNQLIHYLSNIDFLFSDRKKFCVMSFAPKIFKLKPILVAE